jgi:hypothetical protein
MSSSLPARRDKNPDGENWMVVATTYGMTEASIIAGRLHSLGIPAVIHREAASAALALLVGPLGEARVLVPEAYYDLAMATLEPDDSLPWLGDGEEEDESDEGDE